MQIMNRNVGMSRQFKSTLLGLPLALVIPVSASLIAILAPGAFGDEWRYQVTEVAHIGTGIRGIGVFVSDFEPTALNNHGQLAFTAEPHNPGEEAIFLASGGTIKQLMRFGQTTPDGRVFSTLELGIIGLNDSGDAAFAFTLEPFSFGPPIYGGIYRWSHLTQTLSPVVVPNVTADPNGGVFLGVHYNCSLNSQGSLAFTAFVAPAGPGYGVFVQERPGRAPRNVARPGDPAPGGGTFVLAGNPAVINDDGDIVFQGQSSLEPTPDNMKLYLKRSGHRLELIPQPSGVVQQASLAMNNDGDVVYGGAFIPATVAYGQGAVYLRRDGKTTRIAKIGDSAPGGGHINFITGVSIQGQISLNNHGDVVFECATDTGDEAIYLSHSGKKLRRIFGIGTVLPGIGTIVSLEQVGALIFPPPPTTGFPIANPVLNDHGQIAFVASVTDGVFVRGALLLATPTDDDDDDDDNDDDDDDDHDH